MAVKFPKKAQSEKSHATAGPGDVPCRAEADMGHGDAAEDEERRETGQGEKPVEDVATSVGVQIDKRQTSEEKLKEGDRNGTALLVDIGEYLRAHACLQRSDVNLESYQIKCLPC